MIQPSFAFAQPCPIYHDPSENAQLIFWKEASVNEAEMMAELFQGSDVAHGRSEMTQSVSAKGKHEAKSWLEKRPATIDDWANHLTGKAGIGMPPLNSQNMVRWGAIDVDIYNGLSIEALNQKIQQSQMPLVLCRSKSGGPHIFLFLKEWVPASDMIEKLDSIAGWLGFGTSEIFPKQAMVGVNEKNPDFGSWINMPYFGGTRFLRYALDANDKALPTITEFIKHCEERRLTREQFVALEAPVPQDLLPDGPPCLNQLMASRPTENRNIILSNIAVYLKKANADGWQAKLDEYNQKFPEPLGSAEVEAIKKSYDKKDYRYQCSKSPLCNFCDSSRCRKTKYGVGGGEFLPAQRSLSMVDTSPPIWYLDIVLPDNKATRISLSTEELQTNRLFQRRCMETIQRMPPSMKAEQWQPIVDRLMQHCTKIEMPPEMSPIGQFKELFEEFLNRATGDSMDDMLRGLPYRNDRQTCFRLKDLLAYLAQQKFNQLRQHEMFAVLRNDYKAVKKDTTIAGRHVKCFQIPTLNNEQSEPLKPIAFPSNY